MIAIEHFRTRLKIVLSTFSLVSKSFRSLLVSPELYKARSLLGCTESCLYVCFHLYPGPKAHWFTLCRKPDRTLNNDTGKRKLSGYVLATVPISHSPPAHFSSLVAVGSNIYNIDGSNYERPSSSVTILNCRSHMWREAPSLRVELMSHSASVIDRKIYVAGRYKGGNSLKNLFEVIEQKASLDPEPISCSEIKGNFFTPNVHVLTESSTWRYSGGCLQFQGRAFRWYDTEVRMWRILKGLVGLPSFPPNASVRLADYGGKVTVLWDEECPSCGPGGRYEKMIWCAVVALERREKYEIWGKVEWFDHVLTVPKPYIFVKVLAATV